MKTTWLIGCVCKSGDTFSLAVLIDRGLDLHGQSYDKTNHFGCRGCDAPLHVGSTFHHLYALFSSQGLTLKKLVLMTVRVHLFPSRTQQLSSLVPTILGWKRPGTIGRCQHKENTPYISTGCSLCVSIYYIVSVRFQALGAYAENRENGDSHSLVVAVEVKERRNAAPRRAASGQ